MVKGTTECQRDANTSRGKKTKMASLWTRGNIHMVNNDDKKYSLYNNYMFYKIMLVVYAVAAAIYDAIRKGRFDDFEGATVYATLFPSNTCAQLIREMGIKKVVYTTNKFSKTKFRKAAQRILEPDVECR